MATVMLAAPTKRCDVAGAAALRVYSEAVTSTTESWSIASQLKLRARRPFSPVQ